MAMPNIRTLAKYIPPVAVIGAVYNAYSVRGVQGFIADLKDIPNMIKYKEDLTRAAIGAVVVIGGHWAVQKFVPAGIIRYAALGVVYYLGTNMVLEAFASGRSAGFSGFFGAAAPAPGAKIGLEGMN